MKKKRIMRPIFAWLLVFSMLLSTGVNALASNYAEETADFIIEETETDTQEPETAETAMAETAAIETEMSETVSEETAPVPKAATREAEEEPEQECKITFKVNGKIDKEVIVPTGALAPLYTPETVAAMPFIGWYLQVDEAGTLETIPFSKLRAVEEDITLHAKFSEDILVTFLDTDGSELKVYEVAKESTVNDIAEVTGLEDMLTPMMGEEFSFWTLQGGDGSAYDMSTSLTGNITLVPQLGKLNIVVFITNGSEIEPQIVATGKTAARPDEDPSREGYIFDDWYEDEACTKLFDFDTSIQGIQYIYAGWKEGTTKYLLNLWVEGLDKAKTDELVYTTTIENVKTGSIIDVVAQGTGDIVAENRATYLAANADVVTLLDYSEFRESDAAKKPLSGTGQTVINVYYKRIEYTVNFHYDYQYSGSLKAPEGLAIKGTTLTDGNGTVHSASSGDSDGAFTVKFRYGEKGVDWPQAIDLSGAEIASGQYFVNWSGYWGMSADKTIGINDIGVAFTNETQMQHTYPAGRTQWREVDVYPYIKKAGYSELRYYYVEVSEEEVRAAGWDPDTLQAAGDRTEEYVKWTSKGGKYAGTRYYKYVKLGILTIQVANPGTSAASWPGTAIDGYESIGAAASGMTCVTKQYQQVFPEGVLDGLKHYRINYFMPKINYELTLVSNGGTATDSKDFGMTSGNYTKTLGYGDPVDLLTMTKKGFTFAGWYTEPSLQNKYEGGKMPPNALTLYAKYQGTDVNVIYQDDGATVNEYSYSYGDYYAGYEDNDGSIYYGLEIGKWVKDKGTFKGWYYNAGNNVMLLFPEGMKLTKSSYTLVAQWTPDDYTVTYKEAVRLGGADLTKQYVSSKKNTLAKNGYPEYQAPTMVGYTFKGWSTDPDGTKANFNTTTKVTGDTDVYAIRIAEIYTITYDLHGGTVDGTNPDTYTIESDDITLINPTRKGYTFVGWTGTELTGEQEDVTIAKGSTGDRAYEAVWAPILFEGYLLKTNEEGEALAGAEFTLTAEDGTKQNLVSGVDGKILLPLAVGSYTITESKAPEGYKKIEKDIVFAITEDYVLMLDASSPANVTVENDGMELRVVNVKEAGGGFLEEPETETELESTSESESESESEMELESESESEDVSEEESESEMKKISVSGTSNRTTSTKTSSSGVKTGDFTNMLLYAILLLGAGTIITFILRRRVAKK